MKNKLLIILIILLSLECLSQNDTWLPEQYVKAKIENDTNAIKFLIPIEGFESPFNNGHVLTFRGELNPINGKKIIMDGKEKLQLFQLAYSINLKYNPEELANELSDASIFISMVGEKLLLEINRLEKKEEIYFINKISGYEFKNIKSAKEHLVKE